MIKPKPLHVLFICPEYPPAPHGGIGVFYRSLTNALQSHSATIRPFVLAYAQPGWRPWRTSTRAKCEYRIPLWPTPFNACSRILMLLAAWLLSWWHRIDVTEVPDFGGFLPCRWGMRGKVVVRLHSSYAVLNDQDFKSRSVVAKLERRMLRQADSWIAVSEFILDKTKKHFALTPKIAVVIHNAIDHPKAEAKPRVLGGEPFLVCYGTISRRKGCFTVLQAFCEVAATHPRLCLLYLGRDTEEQGISVTTLLRSRTAPEFKDRVRFAGFLPHTQALEIVAGAVALVSASEFESFGLAVAEGMALGRAVLTPPRGPFSEYISQGVTGFFARSDDVQGFVGELHKILANPAQADKIGENAQQWTKLYLNWDLCVAATLQHYNYLLDPVKRVNS